jgi:excisionase family DNA binding protein
MSEALNTLTTEEAAQALGVTPSRVRQMIRSGQLPAKRFGKAHLILESDLEVVRERPIGRPPKSAPVADKRATRQASASNGDATGTAKATKKGGKK